MSKLELNNFKCPLCGEIMMTENDIIICDCGKIYCMVCGGTLDKDFIAKQKVVKDGMEGT